MTSTAPLTPSNRSPMAHRRKAPVATPHRSKRKAIKTWQVYVAAHRASERRFAIYVASDRKGSVRLSQAILGELGPSAALYLYANNIDARIAFAAVAKRHMAKFVARHGGMFFWVTLIPKQFALPENEAAGFDPRKIQRWAHQALRGLSYVGMVEPAYYTNVGALLGRHQRAISWHAHLLLCGADEDAIQEIMEHLNRKYAALLPGVVPAYAVAVSEEEVIEKLLYMLKSPQSNYRVWAIKRETIDPETGEVITQATGRFRQKKGELRPGEMARMCKVLEDKYLDKLAFAGGGGKAVLAAIRKEALRPFRQEEARLAARHGHRRR